MMNYMLSHKSDFEEPKVRFLFGGYSWDRKRFYLWHIHFDRNEQMFVGPEVRSWKGLKTPRIISFIGDYNLEFRERLIALMQERKKFVNSYFDMEPFEVLRDMIRENDFEYIGGPPQLLKVYEHMNRSPISVKWVINETEINTLLGRPLQEYEINNYPSIDPDTLKVDGGTLYG
jgi:hypothetical protein